MLLHVCLVLAVESVLGEKQSFRGGNRFAPVPYYNASPRPGNGVGVLQDLSNARILSNEPFIISFEFPKLVSSGDPRKSRFRGKSSRSKSQRKKNRKPRRFRHVALPETEVLGRRKRLEIMRRPPPRLGSLGVPNSGSHDWRSGTGFINPAETSKPSEGTEFGSLNLESKEDNRTSGEVEKEQPIPVQTVNSIQEISKQVVDEELKSVHQQNWENVKNKWMSMFAKQKEGNGNEVDDNEEKLKAMSGKMWANCQLLKLLKAPQRNPYFYKLLPPNYPALIVDEEKQLQCNQFYDITDLAKDKQMISEKIEQLERILRSGNDYGTRRKREAPEEEEKAEEENTLQDESLQGKLEGEVRSDRSKRTKERQHIRRQRSKDHPKEKARRVKRPAKKSTKDTKESRRSETDRQSEATESGTVKRARRKDKVNELSTKRALEENDVKPEQDIKEEKRGKQEMGTGKDNSLQDVFNPSEVNKVIRQKEMEANIFDKVLRAMRKFEDNNPYDEGFRPQKRESGNSTENTVVVKNDASEEGWELEDTIKKLAKIFKVLGVKAEAAKKKACTDCKGSEEALSEESTEVGKSLKAKSGKSPKCTCADCPFCQNCLQCFKECKKAALAAKNSLSSNQTPLTSSLVAATKGLHGEKDPASDRSGREMKSIGPKEENVTVAGDRGNNVKLERMYRSKLPPSRDLVRVYFDNPENKLLVWTKRGRRTMPWGPLTSDLQLYRDRARQILKSAEDILQRIRETEEKLHAGQYDENEHGESSDKTQKISTMDDIINTVVNEDETKAILKTPWKDELAKGVIDGKVVQSNHIFKDSEEGSADNIFKDGTREKTELPKESLTLEDVKGNSDNEKRKPANVEGESRESYESGKVEAAESKLDTRNRANEIKSLKEQVEPEHRQGTTNSEMDGESVEAAVLPVENKEEDLSLKINFNDFDNEKNVEQIQNAKQSIQGWNEQEEEEDIPAKVEPINQDKASDELASTTKSKVKADRYLKRKNVVEYIKKLGKAKYGQRMGSGESKENDEDGDGMENLKKVHSDELYGIEQSHSAQSQSEEGSRSVEKENVKNINNDESEKVEGTSKGECEEVEKASSCESDETEKTHSGKSGEVRALHASRSEEAERTSKEESEEVEKANDDESEEVGESYKGKSELREVAHSRESEEIERASKGESAEGRKAYGDESDEADETYADESESAERAHQSSESQDVEKSVEKVTGELKNVTKHGESTLRSQQEFQENADVEKNVDNVVKELKTATKMENDEKLLLTDTRKEESVEVEKSAYEKDESGEESSSYQEEERVEGKGSNPEEVSTEEAEDNQEDVLQESPQIEVKELEPEAEEAVEKSHEEKTVDGDHSKSIEESYIMQGVKQSKEEKEAILKALLNAKKNDEKEEVAEELLHETEDEDVTGGKEQELQEATKSEKEVKSDADPLGAVVQHLEKGHINENDLEAIKKLDDAQMDLLVGEMHKNDEKGKSINCETRMKLCQAVCSCSSNGTDSDLTKYEIIKGFLGWLKDLNMEKMAPISV